MKAHCISKQRDIKGILKILKNINESDELVALEVIGDVAPIEQLIGVMKKKVKLLILREMPNDQLNAVLTRLRGNDCVENLIVKIGEDKQRYEGVAELIAEILKRNTKIRTLDVSKCALNEVDAEKIATALKGNNALRELNVSSNPMGAEGAKAFAKSLRVNRGLHTFICEGVKDVGDSIHYFENIRDNNALLKVEVTDKSRKEREFWLDPDDGSQVEVTRTRKISEHSYIAKLMKRNEEVAMHIVWGGNFKEGKFEGLKLSNEEYLVLNNGGLVAVEHMLSERLMHYVSDQLTKAMKSTITKAIDSLKKLVVQFEQQNVSDLQQKYSEVFNVKTENLEASFVGLDGYRGHYGNETWLVHNLYVKGARSCSLNAKIYQGLSSSHIKHLFFHNVNFGVNGLDSLIASEDFRRIGELSFDGCELGDAGAAKLASMLGEKLDYGMRRTKSISLNNNGITDTGVVAICSALSDNRELKELSLKGNNIGGKGAEALGKLLTSNIYLVKVAFDFNCDADYRAASTAIGQALQVNRALLHFDVNVLNVMIDVPRAPWAQQCTERNRASVIPLADELYKDSNYVTIRTASMVRKSLTILSAGGFAALEGVLIEEYGLTEGKAGSIIGRIYYDLTPKVKEDYLGGGTCAIC